MRSLMPDVVLDEDAIIEKVIKFDFMILKGDLGCVEIDVLSVHKSTSNDFWDNNWLTAIVKADLPGFKVYLQQELRKDDFAYCLLQLKEFLDYKRSEAFFTAIEEGIYIHFLYEDCGNIVINGKITEIDLIKCSMEFSFISERFYIESFMRDIETFMNENPMIGQ